MAACVALGVSVSACESTEQESAKLNKEGQRLIGGQGAVRLGAVNRSVKVSDVTLLSSEERSAVAVRLSPSAAQSEIPVLLSITGADGRSLYSNQAGGLETSLAHTSLAAAGRAQWWVDDQVLLPHGTSTGSVRVRVQVGSSASSHPASAPGDLRATGAQLSQQGTVNTVSGQLAGSFPNAHSKVAVFAVAVHAGKVVAAGRAIVSPPSTRGEKAPFQIFLIGNPSGASLQLSVAPTNS